MEIKILRSEILKGLGIIQGIVERKTTMPILSNALLETKDKKLSITATDLEVGINCLCAAEVLNKGKVLISGRKLFDIVRELPEEQIRLTLMEKDWIEITCGKSRYKVVGLSTDEFPVLPQRGEGDMWKMDVDVLLQMIEKTAFAMSTDETRFNLNGVYLDPLRKGGKTSLKMVATDGHRLSIVEREAGAKCNIHKGSIIPRKGVMEIKKILDGADAPVDMWMDSKHLILYRDNISLVVRLIDGQFPPYEQIIPKETKRVVVLKRDLLASALKRVSVLATEKARGVQLSLSPKNLDVFASNPDIGEAREEIEVAYKGESFSVGFNAKYLLDALNVLEDEQVVLQLGDETSPCVFQSEIDRGFTHIVMPMRL